jgi:hypothetical protein
VSAKVEYGKNGLIAAVYERGVNDDGDSINTSETYYKFDGKGKLIQEEGSGESGEWITAYTYDAAGKLIMKQTATIDPPTYKYKYDAKGRLMEVNVTQKWPNTRRTVNGREKPSSGHRINTNTGTIQKAGFQRNGSGIFLWKPKRIRRYIK